MSQLVAIRESKEDQGLVLIVDGQEALLLLTREESVNHKIVLSSAGVGSYEVVFTVVKEACFPLVFSQVLTCRISAAWYRAHHACL